MLTGSCLCGDIAFAIDGPIETMANCHCSMCRKFHGSAFATFGTTAPEHFKWVRGDATGSGLTGHRPRATGDSVPVVAPPSQCTGKIFHSPSVPMGNVAEDPGTRPQLHFFTGSMAPRWHSIVDDLPRHDEYPPEFGPAPISVERPARQPQTPGATAGSCLCGAAAFEFDDPPLRMYNCHCSRCRRAVSAAYQTVVRVRRSGFRWLAGADLTVTRTGILEPCFTAPSAVPAGRECPGHVKRRSLSSPRVAWTATPVRDRPTTSSAIHARLGRSWIRVLKPGLARQAGTVRRLTCSVSQSVQDCLG